MDRPSSLGRRQSLPPLLSVAPASAGHMPPQSDDGPHTPEPRGSASGLAGVFKNLTAGRLKPSVPPSPIASVSVTSAHASLSRTLSRDAAVGGALPGGQVVGGPPDFDELLSQLQPGSPLSTRVSAAETALQVLEVYPIKNVSGIWSAVKDLIHPGHPDEVRKAAFDLLTASVKYSDLSPLERRHFFDEISALNDPEDFQFQLAAFIELTSNGRNLDAFETSTIPVLTRWLRDRFQQASAARAAKKEKVAKGNGKEEELKHLFEFVTVIVKFNFKAFKEEDIIGLLEQVLSICRNTTAEIDIKNSIELIDTTTTYAYIPRPALQPCIEVLCGIYCQLKSFMEPTWTAINNLLKSHVGHEAINVLLSILRKASDQRERNLNSVRGAVHILQKVVQNQGKNGIPNILFTDFIDALHKSLAADSPRLEIDIMNAIISLFDTSEIVDSIIEEPWGVLLSILAHCSRRLSGGSRRIKDPYATQALKTSSKGSRDNPLIMSSSRSFLHVINQLALLFSRLDAYHQKSVIDFFMLVPDHLPDTCAEILVNYYRDENLFYPSHARWLGDSKRLIEVILKNSNRPVSLRLLFLSALREAYSTVSCVSTEKVITDFVTSVMGTIRSEANVLILEALTNFAVVIAIDAGAELFDQVLTSLFDCASTTHARDKSSPLGFKSLSPISRPPSSALSETSESPAGVTTRGLVQIFILSLNKSAVKTRKSYDVLLDIARADNIETDARLAVMKLLFRLRSDSNHSILVIPSTESESVAVSLCRTVESAFSRELNEDLGRARTPAGEEPSSTRTSRSTSIGHPQSYLSRSSTRSASGTSHIQKPSRPLWMYPNTNDLPAEPPATASHLVSSSEGPPGSSQDGASEEKAVLSMNRWLDVIISILQNGADWELYSYVLVHLGSQLTNHSLFDHAVPQIRTLRSVLCEQIKLTSFHEPPSSTGLKKTDVALCIYHIITMLLSYREHFTKSEEDDVVRTFVLGIGTWDRTSQSCIHSLSICCHEVPLSIAKSLNNILQKMSQIITQARVSVHILEFLAGLARLPDVYVNFRDAEFRIVFGIAFRYLQYVRDQRERDKFSSSRSSELSGRYSGSQREYSRTPERSTVLKTSDDLPQYVYALAFHVITFWFMALKLQDRPKHITWMTKNLVSGDREGKEVIEEQSRVTLDMMQRVAFSDRDETLSNPDFAKPSDGAVFRKSWIIGLSIVTVETAVTTGVSQITKRQPSGTSHFIMRPQTAKPPHHQTRLSTETKSEVNGISSRVNFLPSNMLLSMTASATGFTPGVQPIPLPDDDATKRAISTFDKNSTVDGHKVGVIYIGEGQTQESEILANIMGSPDYTEFIEGLGTLTRLKGAKFNTQGLDREYDTDGEFAFCWRDRVTEMIFHVTTMMPTNLDHDPQCINKKRHTGNDFVNIIFNDSGRPFRFDTFPSDFNYVNIVVTPESRASFVETRLHPLLRDSSKRFYKVQVMSKPGFPEISPAAETKMISGKSLPNFVRQVALNASVFSSVWAHREGGENVSSWRNRLRAIVQLRDKNLSSSANLAPAASIRGSPTPPQSGHGSVGTFGVGGGGIVGVMPGHASVGTFGVPGSRESSSIITRRASAATFMSESTSHRSSLFSSATETETGGGSGEESSIADGYDFSRWA
ncbi:MAG: hypothetical protein M1819_004346 [Sarea resinae]|nr:MAG: hypothetical protein M1819_004346 [Sarea resinae]